MPTPIAELFITVGADTAAATAALSGLSGSLKSAGQSIGQAGRTLTAGLTVPIVGAAAVLGGLGIGFEHEFTAVRKTVDETTTDMGMLRTALLDMAGTDVVGGKSAGELAKIAEAAGSLGISGAESIIRFTQLVAQLSIATGLAVEDLGRDFANIALLTKTSEEDWGRLADTLVELANVTEAKEGEIIEHVKRIGSALSAVGVKPDEILGIAAALNRLQLNPEAAGTAISRFFSDMVKGALGSEDALKSNARALENLRDKLLDLQGALNVAIARQAEFGRNTPKSVVLANANAIEKYQREIAAAKTEQVKLTTESKAGVSKLAAFARVAGVTEEEFKALVAASPAEAFTKIVTGLQRIGQEQGAAAQLKAFSDIGITDARELQTFQTLAGGAEKVTDALATANKAWQEQSALQTENAKAMEDTQNQITALKNRIEADMIKFWDDEMKKTLKDMTLVMKDDVLPRIADLKVAVGEMSPEFKKAVLIFAAAAAVLGPLVVIIASVISVMAVLVSPAGVIFLAIAAIFLLKTAWEQNWGDIQGITNRAIDSLHAKLAEFAIGIRQAFAGAIGKLAEIFATIGGLLPGDLGKPFKDASGAILAYQRSLDEATQAQKDALLAQGAPTTALSAIGARAGVPTAGTPAGMPLTPTQLNAALPGDVGPLGGVVVNSPLVSFTGDIHVEDEVARAQLAAQTAAAVMQALIDAEGQSTVPVTVPLPGVPTGLGTRSLTAGL